jgi:hypothetical protein
MVIVPPTDTLIYPTLQSIHDAVEQASYDFQTGFASSACGHSPYDALICLWDSGTGIIDTLGYLFGQPFLDISDIEVVPAGARPAYVNISLQNAWTLPSLSDQIYVGATVEQESSGYTCNLPYEKLTVASSGEAQVEMTLPLNLEEDEEYTFIFRSWNYCLDIASCPVRDNGCYADGCCEDAITGETRTLTGDEISAYLSDAAPTVSAEPIAEAETSGSIEGSESGADTGAAEDAGMEEGATNVAAGCALHPLTAPSGSCANALSVMLVFVIGLKLRRVWR